MFKVISNITGNLRSENEDAQDLWDSCLDRVSKHVRDLIRDDGSANVRDLTRDLTRDTGSNTVQQSLTAQSNNQLLNLSPNLLPNLLPMQTKLELLEKTWPHIFAEGDTHDKKDVIKDALLLKKDVDAGIRGKVF
jgi:hypothetical protein